jgi:uncharacterized membrane protein
MNCSGCGRENPAGARYCGFCGLRLDTEQSPDTQQGPEESVVPTPPELPQDASVEEQLTTLQRSVGSIAAEVSRLSHRVSDLERGRVSPAAPSRSQPAAGTPPRPQLVIQTPISSASRSPATSTTLGGGRALLRRREGPFEWFLGRGLSEKVEGWSWEWLLGGNWLARIGVVALVIGAGFFLKLAFDNDWIGETGRLALGIAGGLAFLGAGNTGSDGTLSGLNPLLGAASPFYISPYLPPSPSTS